MQDVKDLMQCLTDASGHQRALKKLDVGLLVVMILTGADFDSRAVYC